MTKLIFNAIYNLGKYSFKFIGNFNFSAPRRPMASRQDSGSGSVGSSSAPAPPRRR